VGVDIRQVQMDLQMEETHLEQAEHKRQVELEVQEVAEMVLQV